VILAIFSRQKKKKKKTRQKRILDFSIEQAKNIEGWLKIYTLFLVYSQIWLSLPKDDRHFFLQTKLPLNKNTATRYLVYWRTAGVRFSPAT